MQIATETDRGCGEASSRFQHNKGFGLIAKEPRFLDSKGRFPATGGRVLVAGGRSPDTEGLLQDAEGVSHTSPAQRAGSMSLLESVEP
jgi:hypothetical protein